MRYTVLLLPEPTLGLVVAHIPALGVTTQGTSLEHAMEMAKEASELVIEDLNERGEDIPVEAPGAFVSSVDIRVPIMA